MMTQALLWLLCMSSFCFFALDFSQIVITYMTSLVHLLATQSHVFECRPYIAEGKLHKGIKVWLHALKTHKPTFDLRLLKLVARVKAWLHTHKHAFEKATLIALYSLFHHVVFSNHAMNTLEMHFIPYHFYFCSIASHIPRYQ